jgi:tol-pal system protein YbgF
MKRIEYLFLVILISIFLLSWIGCGSSRKTVDQSSSSSGKESGEDFDEIEKLLGISRDDSKKPAESEKKQVEKSSTQSQKKQSEQPTAQTQKQDDLITLLEVDEGKKATQTTQSTSGAAPVEDQRLIRLQSQVDELQKEIKKKDMEIADLKTQLAMKDEALQKKSYTTTTDYSYSASTSKTSSSAAMSGDEYVDNYQNALGLFHERRYQEAVTEFERLLSVNSSHSYADNAQYWIGECYYAMGKYNEAIMAFEKVQSFPKSNKNDYALFKLGQCYTKLGDSESAKREFQQLLDTYPESELVPRARKFLSQS